MMSGALSDLDAVLDLLSQGARSREPAPACPFTGAAPVVLARAPGRLDVMGGFADYSGSLTLELPIREAAYVAAQRRSEPWVVAGRRGLWSVANSAGLGGLEGRGSEQCRATEEREV